MPFIQFRNKEIHCKLVYYGPGLCGKTTNVQTIYNASPQNAKGRLLTLNTDSERTLFFDFMPLSLGTIRGFKIRFHIYTVPGQIFYRAARKLILKGADGIIFVADSQSARMDANCMSLEDLDENLLELGRTRDDIPFVLQCNKRDLQGIESVENIQHTLEAQQVPTFEASAHTGEGVFETVRAGAKLILKQVKQTGHA